MSSSPEALAATTVPLGDARASATGSALRETPEPSASPALRETRESAAQVGRDVSARGTRGEGFAALAYPAMRAVGVDSDAVQRGYAAGLARGRARAERELAERAAVLERDAAERRAEDERRVAAAVQRLERAASALGARVAPVLDEAERTLGEAALALAAAVVGAELARDPGGVARTVLDAVLARPEAADLVAVRMHPLAIADIGDHATGAVRLEADATLAVGDAVGELPDGLLDATVAGALARAKRALLGDDA
jgi:flagellar assembly protein FliH